MLDLEPVPIGLEVPCIKVAGHWEIRWGLQFFAFSGSMRAPRWGGLLKQKLVPYASYAWFALAAEP
jgi:hypothetical protein